GGLPATRPFAVGTVWAPDQPEVETRGRGWPGAAQRLVGASVSGDGQVAVVEECGLSYTYVFDADTGRIRALWVLPRQGRAVAFLPPGGSPRWLAISIDENVHLYDAHTWDAGPVLRGHDDRIPGLPP